MSILKAYVKEHRRCAVLAAFAAAFRVIQHPDHGEAE